MASANVSVIVPVRNAERTIGRALDSVFSQTYSNFELIVVDDGSSDRTVDLVSQYDEERLRLVRHTRNRGAAAARNTGINEAQGRWIAFLDADDVWLPEKLGRQIDLVERAGVVRRACSTGYIVHKEGREREVRLNLTPRAFRTNIFFGCTFSPGTTLMVERTIFDEIGLFDEELRRLEDWDWLLRFSQKFDMYFVPEALARIYLTIQTAPESVRRSRLVLDAVQRITLKHGSRYSSRLRRMQLKSSLLIETAAVMYRNGKPLVAARYVIKALIAYPFRNFSFFGMLVRSVVEQIRSR